MERLMGGKTTVAAISSVVGRQIYDSRGRPTVEADVVLTDGTVGRASVPSGASTGRHEARELRDGDATSFGGLGVRRAVANVCGEIAGRVAGLDAADQAGLDAALIELDGSASLGRLGANAVLATSIASCRAAAQAAGLPLHRHLASISGTTALSLPMPMTNILSGGAHAGRGMDLQDFLVVPVGASGLSEAIEMVSKVRNAAADLMRQSGLSTLLADEGGLSPGFSAAEKALDLMVESFEAAGLRPGEDVAIALDVAASELFEDGRYVLPGQGTAPSSAEMVDFIIDLVDKYPIVSVEDALEQDDWKHWQRLTSRLGRVQIVGDDLFVTNVDRISRGISEGVANAALIKVNQNGTLTGTLAAIATARSAGYATVVSARSGETEDSFIADLAVGTGAGQIKIGSFRNSERLAKYNQLVRIESLEDLPFSGISSLASGGTDTIKRRIPR